MSPGRGAAPCRAAGAAYGGVLVERRTFLALGLAGGGAALLTACGNGKKTSAGGVTSSTGNPDLVVIPNDWDFMAGRPYRLAILLASNKNNGAPVTLDAPVTIRVGPHGGVLGPPMTMELHTDGPEPNYALTTYTFPTTGNYDLQATFKGTTATTPIQVIAPAQSATPVVGQKMISVPTPTVADHQGVNPYCTQQPACPFHQTSLDVALTSHQPVALLFATPALCQSRFCGPVLSNLVAVSGGWTGKVTFIHCEIYTDLTGNTGTKPVLAYGLQHEPMLYLADATGMIVDRIDNLFDRVEARAAADPRLRRARQLKLLPQPQVRLALGLLMANPAPWSPSL